LQKLTETKLKSLYTELSEHDKEQVKLKRLKSDGLDKDGLQEAAVRKKFRNILSTYSLLEHFEEGIVPEKFSSDSSGSRRDDNQINKNVFKDKKLAKLWEKAERSGFDQKELKLLKDEFLHHQDKVEEYYSILEKVDAKQNQHPNFLDPLGDLEAEDHLEKSRLPSKKYPDGGLPVVNDLRTKHRELKDGYDVLHKKVAGGRESQEFSEPRVANLWKLAKQGAFSPEELESLREELKHYEKRLEKLTHFQMELLNKKLHAGKKEHLHTDKDDSSFYEDKIKRQERHVEKLHNHLEAKIMNRHGEL